MEHLPHTVLTLFLSILPQKENIMNNIDLKLFYETQKEDADIKLLLTCEEGKEYNRKSKPLK